MCESLIFNTNYLFFPLFSFSMLPEIFIVLFLFRLVALYFSQDACHPGISFLDHRENSIASALFELLFPVCGIFLFAWFIPYLCGADSIVTSREKVHSQIFETLHNLLPLGWLLFCLGIELQIGNNCIRILNALCHCL